MGIYSHINKPTWLIIAAILIIIIIGILAFPSEAEEPFVISMEVSSPTTVIYGHRPLPIVVTLTNNTNLPQVFSGTISFGGDAWSGENKPALFSEGTSIYMIGVDRNFTYIWNGSIDPFSSVQFEITTYSWIWLGNFPFLTVDIADNHHSQAITVTEGNENPQGRFWFDDETKLQPGEARELWLETTSSKLVQFQTTKLITCTCEMTDLPTGFTGNVQRTWEQHLWYVTLPKEAGSCSIEAEIRHLPGEETFTVKKTFFVGFQTFIPLVSN